MNLPNHTTLFNCCQGHFCEVTGMVNTVYESLSVWQLIGGLWVPYPPAGHSAACLLYLTSQPESRGPVRLRGRASEEKRSEEKERSNYVQSLSSEDPPGSLQRPCVGDKTSAIWSERSRNVLEEYDTSRSQCWQEKQD